MASLLVLTVLLPLVGSLVLFLSPGLDRNRARLIALGTVLATLALSVVLLMAFQRGVTTPQFAQGPVNGPYGFAWMERLDIRFALGLDGISIWLFALTSLLMITAVFASWESINERAAPHYALLLALQAGTSLEGALMQASACENASGEFDFGHWLGHSVQTGLVTGAHFL